MKAQPFDMLGATCPTIWHHIPENSNHQQHHCGNLNSHILKFTHVSKSKTGNDNSNHAQKVYHKTCTLFQY
jgi:hypothetical protein